MQFLKTEYLSYHQVNKGIFFYVIKQYVRILITVCLHKLNTKV